MLLTDSNMVEGLRREAAALRHERQSDELPLVPSPKNFLRLILEPRSPLLLHQWVT